MASSIYKDRDIREQNFSLDDKLTLEQVHFVARRLSELISRQKESSVSDGVKPTSWQEWRIFIEAAYACGFVCRDAGEHMDDDTRTPIRELIETLKRHPNPVEDMSLREIRQIIHFVMRDERWGDQGQDTGGGGVWGLISSPLGNAIVRRLGT
ncbi:hypothetical protein [Roseovarius pacificus]|uniref:hypothetical protein n=1 Tax=Roseovarius pacificus TaxID=337701 RepID=UPI0040391548